MQNVITQATTPSLTEGSRVKRLGQLGFWFFFAKGMLYLIVPLMAAWIGT